MCIRFSLTGHFIVLYILFSKTNIAVNILRRIIFYFHYDTISPSSLGWEPSFFSTLLNDARETGEKREEGKTVIYTSWGTEWKPFGIVIVAGVVTS